MNPSTVGAGPVDNTLSPLSRLRSVPLNATAFSGGFWQRLQDVNRTVSIPHGYAMIEATNTVRNMAVAAGQATGEFAGFWFADSDLYKWLEAAAWEMGRTPDNAMQTMADSIIALIEAAQQPDGYLNSYVQIAKPGTQWTDMDHGHELYCAGHLIQAAVAFQRALGDDRLMRVALRFVDHLYATFGPTGRDETDGHPESEMALVELYRVTGDLRHLELAQLFIDRRGRNRMRGHAGYGAIYQQDHVPVREATEVAGHAVRQIYLTTGATDLYMETGEQALFNAMTTLWADMTERKMYITGGLGSRFDGEAFGSPYELPSDTCYCETCAAIASLMWNWRMLLVTGDGRYADVFERTLYNGVLASPGLEGASYLYVNPLHVRAGRYVRASTDTATGAEAKRPAWHNCACCPPNVMRLFSSLSNYVATTSDSAIQIHQYADANLQLGLPVGAVTLSMHTEYPWDGTVTVRVGACPKEAWSLALRIPAWAKEYSVRMNGEEFSAVRNDNGYVVIERAWRAGDHIELALPMLPRWITPNPRIDAVRGCVALERGPLVYCFESHDQPADVELADVRVDTNVPAAEVALEIPGGGQALQAVGHMPQAIWTDGLYQPLEADAQSLTSEARAVTLIAIPYYAWGNRGMRSMRVWLPQAPSN